MVTRLPQEFDGWNQNISDDQRCDVEERERDAILTFLNRLPYSIAQATELKGYARSKNGRAVDDDEHEKVIQSVFRRLRFGVDWCVTNNIGTPKWLDDEINQRKKSAKESATRQAKPFRPPSPECSAVWLLVILKRLATGETESAKQMLSTFGPGVALKDTVLRFQSMILKAHETKFHPELMAVLPDVPRAGPNRSVTQDSADGKNSVVPPSRVRQDKGGGKRSEEADDPKLPARLVFAKAVYEWAISTIPGADNMTIPNLFDAIQIHPDLTSEFLDRLPDNSATFGKYLKDAGIDRYNTNGGRKRRQSRKPKV
jgi:hypothetical protein